MKGVQVPQLDSLLRFCYFARVSPLRPLDNGAVIVDCARTDITVSPESKQKTKKHYRVFHAEQIRSTLEAELLTENDPPRPMSAVAKQTLPRMVRFDTWMDTPLAHRQGNTPIAALIISLIQDTYSLVCWEHVAEAFREGY